MARYTLDIMPPADALEKRITTVWAKFESAIAESNNEAWVAEQREYAVATLRDMAARLERGE